MGHALQKQVLSNLYVGGKLMLQRVSIQRVSVSIVSCLLDKRSESDSSSHELYIIGYSKSKFKSHLNRSNVVGGSGLWMSHDQDCGL